MKQLSFIKSQPATFGGTLARGKRKDARPLSTKKPLHLVLKSKRAILFRNKITVSSILRKQAKLFGIKLYSLSVQKDHIHISLKIPSRAAYVSFVRATAGLIARRLGKDLWMYLPFSRIVEWGRAFHAVEKYIFQNEMEVHGVWEYKPRRR